MGGVTKVSYSFKPGLGTVIKPVISLAFWLGICVGLGAATTPGALVLAQNSVPTSGSPPTAKSVAALPNTAGGNAAVKANFQGNSVTKPRWQDLTPVQQASLKPLAANWAGISEAQKRKWIALTQNFNSMAPADQVKLHSRMAHWVSLSAEQRAQARLNFAETKKLSSDEKAANWKAYQALSVEDKQKLAAQNNAKPVGAAAAVKPVPPQKLANVPSTRKTAKPGELSAHNDLVDAHTLLPRIQPQDGPDSKN